MLFCGWKQNSFYSVYIVSLKWTTNAQQYKQMNEQINNQFDLKEQCANIYIIILPNLNDLNKT